MNESLVEDLVKELQKSSESEITYHRNQVARIQNELKKIMYKKDNLLDALIEKSISKDVHDKKLLELSNKEQILTIELQEHLGGDTDHKSTMAIIHSVAKRAYEIFESSKVQEKRQLLNFLLSNSVVNEKKLYYTMKSPFNVLLNIDTITDWGARWELNPY